MNNRSQVISQAPQMMNLTSQRLMNPPPPQFMNQTQLIGHHQGPVMKRSYKPWQDHNNPTKNKKFHHGSKLGFGRSNWKGKKFNDMREAPNQLLTVGGGYQPPNLNELQHQNRVKARKFYPKKKRFAPYAPRNTTSFIMRAKKSGGIASLVSPCPLTPAVLPTPILSPSREVLGDMVKEVWGVDGYGSMKGLIRLRNEEDEDENEEENNGSGESDVEEEGKNSFLSRLDHETSRFEMVLYPNQGLGMDYNNVLENRVDDKDSHIARLEEENLTLKERLFLMESELGDLRRRLQLLERQNRAVVDGNEENASESSSGEGSDIRGMSGESKEGDGNNVVTASNKGSEDADMVDFAESEAVMEEDSEKGNDPSNEEIRDEPAAIDGSNEEDGGSLHPEKSSGDGD